MFEIIIQYITQPIGLILLFIILKRVNKLRRRTRLIEIKHEATNHALEKHIGNGYAEIRASFIDNKIKDDKFINTKDLYQ